MKKTFKTLVFAIVGLLALASCEDVPAPFVMPDKDSNSGSSSTGTIEPKGDGTAASPYNVAAIVAKIKEMEAGVESTEEYYIKGKVKSVSTTASAISQYGNHTFEMIDEGDNSTVFTAFQVYGPGKKKFTSVDDIKVGDEVVVCGRVVNFKGNTPETVGKGAAYVVSINSSGNGGGSSSEEGIAVTCAEAVQQTNALADGATSTETYTVTGYITEIVGNVSKNQQTFWMADTKEGGKVFEAYWANLPEGVTEFKVGMKVKITGQLMKYVKDGKVTPEIKNATVVILEAGDGGQGGGTDVPSDEAKGSGTESDPYNAIAAIQYTKSLGSDMESTNDIYVTGIISSIKYTYSSSFGTATYNISVDGKAENEFTVYGSYYLNNQPWKDGDTQIQIGDDVVVCGKVVNYKGNTPEFVNKKNWLVSIKNGSDAGQGGDGGGGQGGDSGQGGGDPVTDLVNGDFESWEGDPEIPTGWMSASSASSAALSKSTEARNGSFACKVGAPGTQNKRLATQEITLEAGSYTFSCYAKSTTADVCQSRAGYVPVTDGSVGSYKYGGYVDINNTDWTLVSYDFDLTETTTVCLVVMNPKNSTYSVSQDILVDDATLVKK